MFRHLNPDDSALRIKLPPDQRFSPFRRLIQPEDAQSPVASN